MGASVRIEDEAFGDLRFRHLGKLLGTSEFDALGRMAHLWRACTLRGDYFLPRELVQTIVDPDAVIAAELAENDVGGGARMRIRGTEGRVEWLSNLRDSSRKGGLATRAKWQAFSPPKPKAGRRPRPGPPIPTPTPVIKNPPTPPLGESSSGKNSKGKATPEQEAAIAEVLQRLSLALNPEGKGTEYRPTTASHRDLILALLRDGYSAWDMRLVIWLCKGWWQGNPEMAHNLRPSTVFRRSKFAERLEQAQAAQAERAREKGTSSGPREFDAAERPAQPAFDLGAAMRGEGAR